MPDPVSLKECAELLDVSVRSLQRAMRDGFPVGRHGGPGTAYRIDPDAAREWWAANRRTALPEALSGNVVDLPGRARREEHLAEREAIRLARDRGQVLDRREVADAVAAMLTALRQDLLPLADKIGKRLSLDRKGRAVVEELTVAALHQAADRLSVLETYETDAA